VTPQSLEAGGLVHHKGLVKILGRGELHRAMRVSAHGFSRSAVAAIEPRAGLLPSFRPPTATAAARQGKCPRKPLGFLGGLEARFVVAR